MDNLQKRAFAPKAQIKAAILLSYAVKAINMVTELAYTPVMLRLLGQSEYGLYTLTNSVISYLGLLTFGISSSYLRFYSRSKAEDGENGVRKVNGMFLLVFLVIAGAALIAGLFLADHAGEILGNKLSPAERGRAGLLMTLMAINLAISIPASVFSSYITAHEEYIFLRILAILKSLLNPFLTFPLLLMGYGSLALAIISLFLTITVTWCEIYFAIKKLSMQISFRNLEWRELKEVYIFSVFVFLNQIVDQVNWSIDSFLLGRFWGTSEVAVYGLASRINSIYLGSSTAISSVFAPRINRIVAENHADKTQQLTDLMTRVGRIQAVILWLILLGLILLGCPFLVWMGGSESYAESYPVVLLLVVPVTIDLMQNIGIEMQRAENKHRSRAVVFAILSFFNLFVSIPLNIRYGAVGAAFGTAISLCLGNGLFMNWHYQKCLGLDMKHFWKQIGNLGRGAILPIIYSAICMLAIKISNLGGFLLVGIGLTVIYGGSMWRWGMNAYEKNIVRRILKKATPKCR